MILSFSMVSVYHWEWWGQLKYGTALIWIDEESVISVKKTLKNRASHKA